MLNALFYTFSTIAQSLAGAIALLGAFLLYRLQSLNSEIDSHCTTLRATIDRVGDGAIRAGTEKEAYRLHHEGKLWELIDLVKKTAFPSEELRPLRPLEHLSAALRLKESLFTRFKWALGLTAGLIVSAVVVLAIAPAIAPAPENVTGSAVVVFVVGIAWLAICVVSYVLLILKSLH